MFDLAFGNELLDRSCHILNRHVWIDAVLIEKIDVVSSQPPQASVRHSLNMFRTTIGPRAALATLKIDVETKLCGNDHLFADGLECFPHQLFVRERPICFSCVEMVYASVIRGSNQPNHLALVGRRSIARAHAHAAEAKSRNLQSTLS